MPWPWSRAAGGLRTSPPPNWAFRTKTCGTETKGGARKKAAPPATAQELQREMTRLRRENQSLQTRCDDLKKALGILAEPAGNAPRAGRRCRRGAAWPVPPADDRPPA